MAEQSEPERQKAELELHNTDATYNDDDETEDDVITFIDPEEQEMLTASRLDDEEMEYERKKAERAAAAVAREEIRVAIQKATADKVQSIRSESSGRTPQVRAELVARILPTVD